MQVRIAGLLNFLLLSFSFLLFLFCLFGFKRLYTLPPFRYKYLASIITQWQNDFCPGLLEQSNI